MKPAMKALAKQLSDRGCYIDNNGQFVQIMLRDKPVDKETLDGLRLNGHIKTLQHSKRLKAPSPFTVRQ